MDLPNIVKLAVEPPVISGEFIMPSFLRFDQSRKLQDIIEELCKGWNIPNPEQYALQHSDTNLFINEQNRHRITNGSVLKLGTSPATLARELYEDIKSGISENNKFALARLATVSEDPTFADEFIKLDGLRTLLYMVEGGTESSELRAHVLTAFQELMEHGIVTWDLINNIFVKKLCSFVSTTALTDPTVLKRSLSILESIVQNSPNFYTVVVKDVTIDSIIHHLHNVSQDVKINTIALINAIIIKTPPDRRKNLASEILSVGVRNVLLTNIIRNSKGLTDEMAHQLYTYQVLTFSFLHNRMNVTMKEDDQVEKEKIENLRKAVFESNIVHFDVQLRTSKDYRRLGFEKPIKLHENFQEVPPGILPLDCMTYFSKQYPDAYIKVVLENMGRGDSHECPFGKASIALVKLLCKLLKIGETPDESSSDYYPIFFTTESPFQELYCICIQLVGKTWREMRAKSEDFGRVMGVVEKQIKEALKEKSPSLDIFKQYLYNLKVDKIIDMIQGSGSGINLKAKPVAHLRERIIPELIELVNNQRLHLLIEGTMFEKYTNRKKTKDNRYWYCRLSQNRRFLHYGDCEQGVVPSADALPHKIALADVQELKTGSDCPHTPEAGKTKKLSYLAFSLIMEKEPLNFVAPSKDKFDLWVDGLSVLLGQKVTFSQGKQVQGYLVNQPTLCVDLLVTDSIKTLPVFLRTLSDAWKNDLNTLLEMEMKLRLLDLEGVTIPAEAPPIPPDPPGYQFRYNFN